MGVRLVIKPRFAASWHAHHSATERKKDDAGPSTEPSLEQTLHFALAAIVIVGWALVYTTLMRGIERGDLARNDRAGSAVSTNLAPRQTPSIPATSATLRQ
jgi:hypothetical protein